MLLTVRVEIVRRAEKQSLGLMCQLGSGVVERAVVGITKP